MKNKKFCLFALCAVMTLGSCENVVLDDELSGNEVVSGSSQLRVVTRVGNDDETVNQARVYLFNSSGTCVEMLSTEEGSSTMMTKLPAGTYSVYAVGGNDLSRYVLPTKSTATPSSVITTKEGKLLGDLLSASTTVTLVEGETQNLQIVLTRKVLLIEEVEVKDVPSDVTAVKMTISPVYDGICLDGSYDESSTTDCSVTLTPQADGSTWTVTPNLYVFPSMGLPTIQMAFTTATGTDAYSYTATKSLEANHKVSFSGTYKVAKRVQVSASLTATAWGENTSVTFDIDNSHPMYIPVAGQFCNGYYVVSVDESTRKAVLLSDPVAYDAPESADSPEWLPCLKAAIAQADKPKGISGNWRLPTLEEATVFINDQNLTPLDSKNMSLSFWCLDDETLKWVYTEQTGEGYKIHKGTNYFSSIVRLRPVIDIDY